MTTITTMDGRTVATLRDRDGLVSEGQVRDADLRSTIPVGDSVLALGRYIWTRDGVRVTPEPWTTGMYVLRSSAAAELGRLGGLSKSDAKARAARENGKRGGRPKKG